MRGVPNGDDALGARVRAGGVRAVSAVCGSLAGLTHPRPLALVFNPDRFCRVVWALEQAVQTLKPRP
jgi:hypothetical protein